VNSSWGACTLPDPLHPNLAFVADAIVSNPPVYGHTHCAEKLNVPLHIVFTMPWTPTKVRPWLLVRQFPLSLIFIVVGDVLCDTSHLITKQAFPSPFARIKTVIGEDQGGMAEVQSKLPAYSLHCMIRLSQSSAGII